jgi:chondroitin AC lyase
VRDDIESQQADGSWPDIDYDNTSRTHWVPSRHLRRLQYFAPACRTPGGDFEGATEVREAFLSGLRFWVERDPQSDNWWSNVIGSPRSLGSALILMGKDVPQDLVEAADPLIRRSGFTRTGANLVWEASNLLTWACIVGDADLLKQAIDHIGNEIRITTEEGIQHDDSFYQHGPQNYALGYGRSFAFDVTDIVVDLAGTDFAFPEEKVRILSRLVLDGQQWFVYAQQIDYHAMGREAFRGRPGAHSWNARGLARICENMRIADPVRAPEYDAFAARVAGDVPPVVRNRSETSSSGDPTRWSIGQVTGTRPSGSTPLELMRLRRVSITKTFGATTCQTVSFS